jgi:protein phosphatase
MVTYQGNAMTSVLNLSLPWMKLQGYLVKMDTEGKIDYGKFLDRFKLKMKSDLGTKWRDAIIEDICSKIYENSKDLVNEFKR